MRNFFLPVLLAVIILPGIRIAHGEEPGTAIPEEKTAAPDSSPMGVIHESSGQVFITKAGDPASSPAEEDMDLGPGDRIATGMNGSVTISLRDQSFVKLGALASLTVKDLRSDQVTGGLWARLLLSRGKLMAVVSSLVSPDSRFEIDTPTAVAAVKGTAFQVTAGSKSTTISVLEGTVVASGNRDDAVTPEELDVKEGFETVVDSKSRRPGPLTKFFKNEKRVKARVALSEFRAKMQKLKVRGQSGDLRRQRRLRVLARVMLIQRFQKQNPAAYQALPEWRRNRMDQFLVGHMPELDASRTEISRYLNSNPKSRKQLEQQISRRFSGAKKLSPRKPGKQTPGTGKTSHSGKQRTTPTPHQ